MVGDTIALLELLRDRFDRTAFVAGFSLGATVGAYAAARPAGSRRHAGDGRDGRRRRRRGRSRVRIRARHGAPAWQPAGDSPARTHRATSAPGAEAVRHPRPLGDQLRWRRTQRDVRQPGSETADQPGALARLLDRRRRAHPSRDQRDPGRAAARGRKAWTWSTACPPSAHPSSWPRVVTTRSRPSRRHSSTPTRWTHRASSSSGSETRPTHPISRNRTGSGTSSFNSGAASSRPDEPVARRSGVPS